MPIYLHALVGDTNGHHLVSLVRTFSINEYERRIVSLVNDSHPNAEILAVCNGELAPWSSLDTPLTFHIHRPHVILFPPYPFAPLDSHHMEDPMTIQTRRNIFKLANIPLFTYLKSIDLELCIQQIIDDAETPYLIAG